MTSLPSWQDVLEFWFSETGRVCWFNSTPQLDAQIRERFAALWETARNGAYDAWQDDAESCLALTIVLDQFPLNMFRGTSLAFASENQALAAAGVAVARGDQRSLPGERAFFLFLPFMHSENLADQDRCVALFEETGLTDGLRWARHHRELIRRFGRFPHRNALLGRDSTPEEIAYLDSPGAFTG